MKMRNNDDELKIWDQYFCAAISAAGSDPQLLNVSEWAISRAAKAADKMLEERKKRRVSWGTTRKWWQ